MKKELDTFLRTYIKFQLRFDFDILLNWHTLDFRSISNSTNLCQNSCLNPLDHIPTKDALRSYLKQVKPSSFTEDQPPGWDEKASKSHCQYSQDEKDHKH